MCVHSLNLTEMNNGLRKQAIDKGKKYLQQAAKKAMTLGKPPPQMV